MEEVCDIQVPPGSMAGLCHAGNSLSASGDPTVLVLTGQPGHRQGTWQATAVAAIEFFKHSHGF